jgi:hypothetical protein
LPRERCKNGRAHQIPLSDDFGAEKREALSVWAAHVATLQAPEGLPLAA